MPHWIKCDRNNPADKWHFEAFDILSPSWIDGTYELIGEKIQGNPEQITGHILVKHGLRHVLFDDLRNTSFDQFKSFLSVLDIEGIVFHHPDGRMCKLRKSDFGIKR